MTKNFVHFYRFYRFFILALYLLFMISMIFSVNYFYKKISPPKFSISMQDSSVNFNKSFVQLLNLGQKRAIAGLLWLKTLLDSDLEHYEGSDLRSWMFLRLDLITDLDKNFKEAYYLGGQYLSVIKDDKLGAKNIFEKGLAQFPDHLGLNFAGGMHDYLELKDRKGAFEKFYRIRNNPGAPLNISSIIAKIKSQDGDKETAFMILQEAYEKANEEGPLKKRYGGMLYDLKSEKDLGCLNDPQREDKSICERKDFFGNEYRKVNGKYQVVKSD